MWPGEDVEAWIARAVGSRDVAVEVVRDRPWGKVARVTTRDGVLFFKEPAAGGRHESVVVSDIDERWPGLVPDVVAAEHDRGWLLMHDHGEPMWNSLDPREQVAVLERIVPRYAQMQRASRELTGRWLSAGTPDRRAERLPELVDDLVAGRSWLGALGVDRSVVPLAELTRVCDALAATTFAAAIDHSDMHGGNVLAGRGSQRLVDWGDSCISHPFASLFVVYQHAVATLPAGEQRGAALRLREAYLQAWKDEASPDELRAAFAKAIWLGYAIRALNFVHMMGEDQAAECRTDVARFLTRWFDKRTLLDDPDELVVAVAGQTEI
jgi:hypothetical protein